MRRKVEQRKKQVRLRKNVLPVVSIIIFLWISLAAIVSLVDPQKLLAILIFFIIAFLALFFTFSTIFANSRRGLISALSVILFLLLSYLGVGNVLNLILTIALAITFEVYFVTKGR